MSITRGIFPSERTAWAAVGSYTILLYGTLTVAYDLYTAVYRRIGEAEMLLWINRLFLVTGLMLLVFIVLMLPRTVRSYLAFAVICAAVAFCLHLITVSAKRFHFFQYAPLTVLVFDAVRFRSLGRFQYVWTVVLVSVIGLGDKTIRWMLPTRFFGIPDLLTNSTAGLLTLVFIAFVLGEARYPFPRTEQSRDRRA